VALDLILIFVGSALVVITATACLNALTFRRLMPSLTLRTRHGVSLQTRHTLVGTHNGASARVSICIPARNEAAVIQQTVRTLLAQTYPNFELLLLDDHSEDGTAALALAAAAGDARLRVLTGKTLPAGWHGKNWACQQLGEAAQGEWLVFSDADVRWQPTALPALIAEAQRSRADLLSVWPTQSTVTWGERLVVPLMALVILGYLPALAVHHVPFASLAAACGQCLCFHRSAYRNIGGHEAVRARIIEDIVFARLIKRSGLRLRSADGASLIGCRMYTRWSEVRDGYAKNIIAGYGSVIGLLLGTLFHWLVFLLPWGLLLALLLGMWQTDAQTALGIGGLCLLGIGVRALTAATTHQRVGDALLMPLSALAMTVIAGRALWWRARYGGVRWKGRTIR
jgi:chlorobactene glucosyltransferase